jgi:2-isopropylmalate synthase
VTAKGSDPDTLVASAKAYVSALNKLKIKQAKGQLEGIDLARDARRGP